MLANMMHWHWVLKERVFENGEIACVLIVLCNCIFYMRFANSDCRDGLPKGAS